MPNITGTDPTWLFDIDSLTRTMNYQPVTTGNQSNPSEGFQKEFDAKKAGEEATQQYMLFPMWSTGSLNIQNKEGDYAFDGKEHDAKKPKSVVNLSPSSRNRDFNADFEDYSEDNRNNVSATGPIVPTAGQNYSNNTNLISVAEADFNNLETSITVSPIPTTRTHKDHPVEQIIVRIEAIRLFLAYASFMRFMVYQMDVKSAFLYGTIKEEVYVCQPSWFEDLDHPDKVYKVVKALYDLHQAPRAWYETLANYLLENSFHRGQKDQTLFIKKQKGDILLVQIYKVDGIFISQDKYVAEILKKFRLTEGKSASTPIDIEKPLLKDPDGEDVNVHIYRSMIVKRIFRYLKGKPHLGLWYPKDSPFDLVAYSDSDYAGVSLDRKSTTGGCQFLGCRLISWQCKKQTIVATSSIEAEYVAGASCCAQVLWIQNQMLDYSDSPLLGVNTPRSDDDRLKLMELMVFLMKKGVCDQLELSAARLLKFLLSGKWFEQIIDFLSGSYIQHALTVNPHVYISCIKQFWNTAVVKRLARMGYEKPSTKLTFCKAFFSFQWKFLIHSLLHSLSAKRTSWNEFNSAMASALICLSTARVKKLERLNKVKSSKLRRLKKVGTFQRVESSEDIENVFNQERISVDVDEGIELEVDQEKSAEVEGRQADTQAEIYNIDLDHSSKVLSMQEDTEVQEVVEVVNAAKLITEVVTAAATQELHKDTPAETLSVKDKGKGILIEDPKLIKKKDQIAMDAEYAKKLQEELETEHEEAYKKIDLNAGFDHGKTYDQILPIFQARLDANLKFLFKSRVEMEKEDKEIIKSINETPAQKAPKRRRLREQAKEDEDLKKQLEIVVDEDDDVFIKATPIGRKVLVVNYEIVMINNKLRYKIIRADDTHQLYTSFITLLKNFNREDLEDLWKIVKARFSTTKPTNFSDNYLLAILKTMFEKTNGQDAIWTSQQTRYGQALVKSWKLLTSCGVHIIFLSTTMFVLLVERRYPLSKFTLKQ
nr:hypothetical protein [Tanacetum cinerariifolium]